MLACISCSNIRVSSYLALLLISVDSHMLQPALGKLTQAYCSVSAADSCLFLQSLQRSYQPLAALSRGSSALQPACASTQETHPKLQHQPAGAGAHDENAEADSVQDNTSSIQVQSPHSLAGSKPDGSLVLLSWRC